MVDFRMTRDGLVLLVKDYESIDDVLKEISDKISSVRSMFTKGDSIALMIENHSKHVQDIPRIVSIVKSFGIEVSGILVGSSKGDSINVSGKLDMVKHRETKAGTKMVKKNVRSGQIVVHSGDVIILGNVHRGAEIMAGGSIVVFGSAFGNLRAGLNEGYSAVVMGIDLRPSLIQIADRVSHDTAPKEVPSVAHVRGGRIVIEKWNEVKLEEVVKR